MLPDSELFEALSALTPGKRLLYEAGLAASVGGLAVAGLCFTGLANSLVTLTLISPDLGSDSLWGAVILPSALGYLAVVAVTRRDFRAYARVGPTFRAAAWKGLKRGFVTAVLVITVWHFLGDVAMARAIFGSLRWHRYTGYYLSLRPIYHGLLFGIPVGLAAGLFTGYAAVSAQVVYNLITGRRGERHSPNGAES